MVVQAIALLALATAAGSPEEHEVRLPGRITMHYVEQGAAGGRPVVLLHGLGDSWQSWERLLAILPGDLRAIAPDLRGHGGSDRPERHYEIGDHAADVVALLQALDLHEVTLIGHSLGSFVAREVARRVPDRVAGLVLIGSAAVARNAALTGLAASLDRYRAGFPPGVVDAFQRSTVVRSVPEPFMRRAVAASEQVPVAVWRQALRGLLSWDDRRRLDRIVQPTMVIWGEEDPVFGREDQAALFAHVRDGQLSVYPGVGHAPHWEHPGRVVDDLERFMLRFAGSLPGADER